jgi:hypothetical protein
MGQALYAPLVSVIGGQQRFIGVAPHSIETKADAFEWTERFLRLARMHIREDQIHARPRCCAVRAACEAKRVNKPGVASGARGEPDKADSGLDRH